MAISLTIFKNLLSFIPNLKSFSLMLAAKIIGLLVKSATDSNNLASSSVHFTLLAEKPLSSVSFNCSKNSSSTKYFLSAFIIFFVFSIRLSNSSMSDSINSKFIVSMSRAGSMLPSTCTISSFSKHLTT